MHSHRPGRRYTAGQAIVEFAIAGIVFFLIVFGTVDFGRAIFMYSELTNAVREGARYAQIHPTQTAGIKDVVVNKSPGLGIRAADVTVSCSPAGCQPGGTVQVTARMHFQAVTQSLLGIRPLTLQASAENVIE
ncbi:TadE/TadG family type IV pilus assembly protein [Sphaerobacter thermophilus]|jgi:Flp pilus assembly protein TadG|uniref:TadE family protein n=1 Tax=Sphaerobacter thermophilus (strain ATCC 49802 / DSM 20745 / KCCM 41009 / NCIMB 13125 / S 6022) TaxID=479434 RepID=D1C9V6_SPHTD|nr:TadE/TadG family type IV pilus assembly protein [Sphaerobacter thermophilus]ACZ40599.1 TadE family protein [Sphaerobacter thermophilus DSM 20745]PZN66719.1 MAG: pilus assembly protein [Sphaerobacter thermophilus]